MTIEGTSWEDIVYPERQDPIVERAIGEIRQQLEFEEEKARQRLIYKEMALAIERVEALHSAYGEVNESKLSPKWVKHKQALIQIDLEDETRSSQEISLAIKEWVDGWTRFILFAEKDSEKYLTEQREKETLLLGAAKNDRSNTVRADCDDNLG